MKKLSISLLVCCFAVTAAFASGHVATATSTNPTCPGGCNGTAMAMASGGIGPYGFSWTGPSSYTGTGASISSLCAGTYIVTATDSSDMSTAMYTISLTAPAAFTASVAPAGPLCAGVCTTLTTAVSGGTGTYTYSWSPTAGLSDPNIANPSACPATTTSYMLSVTDANSCLTNAPVTIVVNPLPPVAVTATGASCGLCTGTLTATGAMTYAWSAGYTTSNPTNVCAGTYTVTGTSGGCSATATATVTNTGTAVAVTLPTIIPASCGACNGAITSSVAGGSPPYSYSWTPGGFTGLGSVSGLCAGTYTLVVTDVNGCSAATSAMVNNTSGITAIGTTTTGASCSVPNGSITFTGVTGGVPPYQYSVDGSAYSATVTYTNLPGGAHIVTVRDASGCVQSNTITIYSPPGPAVVFYTTVPSGCTTPTGEIHITSVGGGMPSYNYAVDGSSLSWITDYTGLSAGAHTIFVVDANGCNYMQNANIPVSNTPVITTDSTNNISCSGSTPGNIYVSISAGTPAYNYSWSPGAITTQDLTGITAIGTYVLTVTDAASCTATHTYVIGNTSTLHSTVTYTYGNCGILATATALPAGGTPPYTYLWNSVPVQTSATATALPNGTYHCTVTDAVGCSTGVNITVYNSCYNLIKGRVYNDANGNCIYDAGDSPIAGRLVSVTSGGSGYGYTDLSGNYAIYTNGMTNTVTHSAPLYTNVICPAGNIHNANFTTAGDTLYNIDFADQYIPAMNDLVINYFPGTARPGFQQYGVVYYKNVGTTTISGVTVGLTLDSILTFDHSLPAPASYSYPAASWNIGTLTSGQSGYIYVYDNIPVIGMGGYIGRALYYGAQIDPVTGDQAPADNYIGTSATTGSTPVISIISAAWDPNEKEVSPAGNILASDSVLHYTIRFQNTGTDTAFTVVLKDTLSQFLDPATVEAGIASHPYTFNVAFNGELTWTFSNILLPDSTVNEPASHGFATFTVKQRTGNAVGTHIDNTAHIYFDFNEAVITNTVTNAIVDVATGIREQSTNNEILVYPNPFTDNTTFVIRSEKANETYTFELRDVLGKTVRSLSGITGKQFSISRNGLQSGIYFYSISSASGITGIGKVVIR